MSATRKTITTTLNEEMYKKIRVQAAIEGINVNDLLEEGMRLVLEKRKQQGENEN